MITIRTSGERGHLDHGWLDTRHTFSFASYFDPAQMGFRALRVINEDVVRGGQGFDTHGHRDMEILTYVLSGALAHRDSSGGGGVLRNGEVQRMSAGTGIRHSEFNASATEPVHLLQIWLLPDRPGHRPSYEQKAFAAEERRGGLRLVASPDGAEGSTTLHQDARVLATLLADRQAVEHPLAPGRHAWVQVARGAVELNGVSLSAGDGAAVSDERLLKLTGRGPGEAELILFDLA
ncbi:MAG TPA: pirin family protein [Anaeromyxobacter sp.]|nr:pirin family protein [Anaeromyxobacter sp.]